MLMDLGLEELVSHFASGIKLVDSRYPVALNARSKKPYQPGIGPHPESQTVKLVLDTIKASFPDKYSNRISIGVPYPDAPRQRCDFCIGMGPEWEWAVEVKMLRILGDNGKPNDNILMHILSPYPSHRSAVTDCIKLASSPIGRRNAILIYGYEAEEYPLVTAIDAFQIIAATYVKMGPRIGSSFGDLVHPIHSSGMVFGWEIWQK
jgi:hypothetical protein